MKTRHNARVAYLMALAFVAFAAILSAEDSIPRYAMTEVPGGSFSMGYIANDAWKDDDAKPHPVTVSTFMIGTCEVTQELWNQVMALNPSLTRGAKNPVEGVSWYQAVIFCNGLSILEGLTPCYSIKGETNPEKWKEAPTKSNGTWNKVACDFSASGYRLPTEAEWEYAAKGGPAGKGYVYSGGDKLADVAWCDASKAGSQKPVGTKTPNELGLYDMSGNVWEWCWDWYGPYSGNPETDPVGPTSGKSRIFRGGNWAGAEKYQRSSDRAKADPSITGIFTQGMGLRLVRHP